MLSLRTDCQYPIYSSVQKGGVCLFPLTWQTTLLLLDYKREPATPQGVSHRYVKISPLQLQRLAHSFAGDADSWPWQAAIYSDAIVPVSPLPSQADTAFSHCPLICLLYYPGCTVIYSSLAFLTYLPIVICSLQSLFLCLKEVSLRCWTFCYSKVVSAGILTASALSAFQKCFFNNTHKY